MFDINPEVFKGLDRKMNIFGLRTCLLPHKLMFSKCNIITKDV